jgi:hypothetical protein
MYVVEKKLFFILLMFYCFCFCSRPPRTMASVVLADNIGQKIVDDVQNFYKSEVC